MNEDVNEDLRDMQMSREREIEEQRRRRELANPHKWKQYRHLLWFGVISGMTAVMPMFVSDPGTGSAAEAVIATILLYHLVMMFHHMLMCKYYFGGRYPVMDVKNYLDKLAGRYI